MSRTNLDKFAPPDHRFTLAGETYVVPGSLPVPTMLRLLQLDEQFKGGTGENGASHDVDAEQEALAELYELVMGLFRQKKPDCPDLPLTLEQLEVVISRITGGTDAESLQELVAEQIAGPESESGEGEAGADPLPSAKPSRKRSSRSAA